MMTWDFAKFWDIFSEIFRKNKKIGLTLAKTKFREISFQNLRNFAFTRNWKAGSFQPYALDSKETNSGGNSGRCITNEAEG